MQFLIKTIAISTLSSALLLAGILPNHTNTDEPLLCVKGTLVLDDDFSSKELNDRWAPAKGEWKIVEGALQGIELKADKHAASIRTNIEFSDPTIVAFDFKFDGGTVIHCSFNGKGHICRATINPKGYTLKGEKDKKNAEDKAVTVAQVQQEFIKGQWYTMQIEMAGKEFVARVNDGPVAFGADEKVARAKNNFGFPMAGVSSHIDNVKVWKATLNPKWSEVKSKLPVNKIVPPAPPTPKQRFARFDKDNDNKVTLKEFIGTRSKDKHAVITKQFQRKDKNKDESLSPEEMFPPRIKK